MSTYKIQGGRPLKGEAHPVPNKNSVLAIIPAALLSNEPVVIHNVPKSSDVRLMIRIIRDLGGKVSYLRNKKNDDTYSLKIDASGLNSSDIDLELSLKFKASIMFMAPLLARFGSAFMPIPGGCNLGTRPLDAFISNMEELGAKYEPSDKGFALTAKNLKAKRIWSWFPSVTGTENLVTLAVMTPGTTEIYNAACEPHVQDLCNFLVSMGAQIEGIGSNRLIVHGVESLHGTEWTIIPEHLDVGAYIAAALMTDGEILIHDAIPEHMGIIIQTFEKLNAKIEIREDKIYVPSGQKLKAHKRLKGQIYDIKSFSWPLLPPDFVHIPIAVALKAQGEMIFHNTFYEYGYFYIEEFTNMGANIIMGDPHRVITTGPTTFKPSKIKAPFIIQAAMALFLAALSAEGTSYLTDEQDSLMRRYPHIVENFNKLGAKVERVK